MEKPEDQATHIRKTAHDIRTPLTSISGFAELILEDKAVPGNAREHAAIILEEAKHLSGMLESFFSELQNEPPAE